MSNTPTLLLPAGVVPQQGAPGFIVSNKYFIPVGSVLGGGVMIPPWTIVHVQGDSAHLTKVPVSASIIESGNCMTIYSGGTATATTVSDGGDLFIYAGGTATATTVSDGGYLRVYSGGTALNVTSLTGADILVSSGGYITYA